VTIGSHQRPSALAMEGVSGQIRRPSHGGRSQRHLASSERAGRRLDGCKASRSINTVSLTTWIESGSHDAIAAAAGQMRDENGPAGLPAARQAS
jgi:hypothetical protein